jgi:DNA-binding MarR family transcriptional regulator
MTASNSNLRSLGMCACGNLRQAARLVTQLYDEALKPSGLLITQFGVLMTIKKMQPATINRLVEQLGMDRTTLTRNLKPLVGKGLVSIVSGTDQRTREVSLTEKAEGKIKTALPLWEAAQNKFLNSVGETEWTHLQQGLSHVVNRIQKG